MTYLKALRFHPWRTPYHPYRQQRTLQSDVAKVVQDTDLVVASVLSGNRNFEGRINPLTRANYLASPEAGNRFCSGRHRQYQYGKRTLGYNPNNQPVFLKDIWPTAREISDAMTHLSPDMFTAQYGNVCEGDDHRQVSPGI
ncbi:MAG: aconitase family protein [Desulfobacterales bacterium]